jgi:hypothetical protein
MKGRPRSAALENEDPAVPRILTVAQGSEQGSRRERQGRLQLRTVVAQERTIPARIRKDEDDVIHATVAPFRREAALQLLAVTGRSLRFDTDPNPGTANQPVPRPQVTGIREGHLRPELPARMQACTEPVDELGMAPIAMGCRRRIGIQAQVETEDRGQRSEVRDGHRQIAPTLDAADLRVIHASDPAALALAEARGDPGLMDRPTRPRERKLALSPPAIRRTLSGGHGEDDEVAHLPRTWRRLTWW